MFQMTYNDDDAKFFKIPDGDVETPPNLSRPTPAEFSPAPVGGTHRIPCRNNIHQPRRDARYQCRRQRNVQHQCQQDPTANENAAGVGENSAAGECSFGCCSVIALILISCIAGMFMAMFAFPQLARSLCANI